MALTPIQQVRLEIADQDPSLPILSDEEYEYFLQKASGNVRRAALDAAKTILFKLSINSVDQIVGILEVKGARAAEQYRLALEAYIRNPDLNPVLQSAQGYIGGVSISDMQSNVANQDNNIVNTPEQQIPSRLPTNFFEV